ncbi:MAG: hypothetical protein CO113_10765 [Elusimicrobia bacterium CG_4_9_14_3_um_filter_62_55]|nr:MAG: hypothetical protein COR54_14090 [Elusimicrobia bacterium CG22_combo_CG10-13_8_21_14_all_63_91]PJA17241.1 MAG: hypothetical protein COX66_05290 [Elusimicrobia bacterium CG_4_10_14_0_2_um_filter_63_34]PJB25053.1 MAG: hypothetical protein CO113_10765 [Elusimicrobia bacterium CG_4_9_14_3_um_filter_62_55]
MSACSDCAEAARGCGGDCGSAGVSAYAAALCRVRHSGHTFATQYIRNGGDPFSLQAILGHSTLEMVRNYVNLGSRDVAQQHGKFSPMDRLLSPPIGAAP